MGIKKQKPTNKGIKIVSGMLAASLFAMPVLLLNGAPTSAASQSATTTVNVTIDPVISITASPNIPTVSTSGTTISGNGWGWSNNATQFNPVKATGTTDNSAVFSRTTAATPTGDNKTLTIGASATTSVPSGTYSNTLLLTAVTNN